MIGQIVSIVTNPSFESILRGEDDGVLKQYLLGSSLTGKDSNILMQSKELINAKQQVFLKVKVPFGRRDKRLEIVSRYDNRIDIYKISNIKKVDKDSLEMDNVISTVYSNYKQFNIEFSGIVLLERMPEQNTIDLIQEKTSNNIIIMSK